MSTRRKLPAKPKSLETFPYAPARSQNRVVVKDTLVPAFNCCKKCVTEHRTTCLIAVQFLGLELRPEVRMNE